MAEVSVHDAFELAKAHHQAGRLAEAESIYRQILGQLPGEPEVLRMLAAIALQVGQPDAAVGWLSEAAANAPGDATLRSQLGYALQSAGRYADALKPLHAAVSLDPDYADAHTNLGISFVELNRYDEAAESFRKALERAPEVAYVHSNLIGALRRCGRYEEAQAAAAVALAAHPNHSNILNSAGDLFVATGRHAEALELLAGAVELDPQLGEAWANGGDALRQLGRYVEAERAYRRAIELLPRSVHAWNNLGLMQYRRAELEEALRSFEQALAISPGDAAAMLNKGNVLKDSGRIDEALRAYRAAMNAPVDACKAHSNLLLGLHYQLGHEPAEVFAEHRRWDERHALRLREQRSFSNVRDPERRLRVGYVTPDFRDHPVGRFMLPVLSHHGRESFELVALVDVGIEDEISQALKEQVDEWHNIGGRSDAEVAEMIRALQIDILVDLAGHTGDNRLLVFARRVAPIQLSYLGYPDTTGVAEIDFRLTDSLADPPGESDSRHSEELVRLDPCAWTFPSLPEVPVVARAPGSVVFGCCNTVAKVSEPLVHLWGRILARVPNSRLVLKANGWIMVNARERVLALLACHGVTPARVEFAVRVAGMDGHFEFIQRIDIALDTFPYHGTSTTCDALWMGVPVITLAGATHVSRVGVSLLTNVGHPEWIASSQDEYVSKAVELANDPARLTSYRATLRDELRASPLMDSAAMAARLESAYRQMWQRWCENR